jgi:hypothetical protein
MKRKRYYEWRHITGRTFWQPKGVHDYLLKDDLSRAYMKMTAFTGNSKFLTLQQWRDEQLKITMNKEGG